MKKSFFFGHAAHGQINCGNPELDRSTTKRTFRVPEIIGKRFPRRILLDIHGLSTHTISFCVKNIVYLEKHAEISTTYLKY